MLLELLEKGHLLLLGWLVSLLLLAFGGLALVGLGVFFWCLGRVAAEAALVLGLHLHWLRVGGWGWDGKLEVFGVGIGICYYLLAYKKLFYHRLSSFKSILS